MSKHHPQDITSGDVPAQDHDPDQAIEGRQVRFCVRIERTLPSGDVLVEGGAAQADTGEGFVVSATPDRTRGDEHGRFVWHAQSPSARSIPMWWVGAAPAVTTEASRDLRPPRQLEQAGSRVRPAQPGSQARPDPADQRVRVRPVGDPGWNADERFREIDAALPGAAPPLPKGYPGVVLVTTQERRQEEVFLPGAGPLVAVDAAGNPALASEVSDLRPDDSLDPDRRARLHTMMRVVRLRAGVGFPTANALAWQLKLASRDGYAGGGAVIDAGSVFAGEGETRADEPPGGGTKAGAAAPVDVQFGATQTRPSGGGSTQPRTPGGDGTRTRPPGSPPTAASTAVVAMCSSKLSGPIDVGRPDDVHRLGTTEDGEPVNSGHLPTSALWIGPGGDAPLAFEHGIRYSRPPSYPFRAPVHLRYDPLATHEHVTGTKPGLWRLEAEVPIYIPDPPEIPDPPPPPPPPPGGSGGTPAQPGGTAGGNGGGSGGTLIPWIPEHYGVTQGAGGGAPLVGTIPDWMVALAEELGVRPGSIGVEGGDVTPAQYAAWVAEGLIDKNGHLVEGGPVNRAEENRAPRYPTMLHTLRLGGGLLMRAYAMGEGAKNTTGTAGSMAVDEEARRQADRAPDVALVVPYAPGDGTPQGFTGVAVSPNGQRIPTTGGGFMPLPAGADPKGVLAGTGTKPAVPLQVAIPPGYTQLAYGTPNPETGLVEDGATTEGVSETENIDGIDFPRTGVQIAVVQGGEVKGTLSLTQVGSTMTLELEGEGSTTTEIVATKVTCEQLDPRSIQMDPVSAKPTELGSSLEPGFWVKTDGIGADQHQPRYFDGTTDHALATGGGAVPAGAIQAYAGSTAPSGWLACDGSAVSRTTYADLFSAIGTTWGAGDGSTTFNVPDFRGRALIGDGTGSGLTARTLGQTLGAETHQLTTAELPSHAHGYSTGTTAGSASSLCRSNTISGSLNSSSVGSDQAHNNMQPSAVVKWLIKT